MEEMKKLIESASVIICAGERWIIIIIIKALSAKTNMKTTETHSQWKQLRNGAMWGVVHVFNFNFNKAFMAKCNYSFFFFFFLLQTQIIHKWKQNSFTFTFQSVLLFPPSFHHYFFEH